MSQEFTDKTQQEIEAYIMHSMSEDEIIAFESRMNRDDLLSQEVLLQQSIHQVFNENDWSNSKHSDEDKAIKDLSAKLNSDAYKKAAQGISTAADTYFEYIKNKPPRKIQFPFYKTAIAITVLLFICLPFFLTNDSLESQYIALAQWDDIPSFIEKGEPTDHDTKGETLFRSKKYTEVVQLYASSKDPSSYTLMYLGISYLELNNTEKALHLFDQLIATESIENSRGYWYKLLVYMKTGDKENVEKMLTIILRSKDNYNYEKALLLSKE